MTYNVCIPMIPVSLIHILIPEINTYLRQAGFKYTCPQWPRADLFQRLLNQNQLSKVPVCTYK